MTYKTISYGILKALGIILGILILLFFVGNTIGYYLYRYCRCPFINRKTSSLIYEAQIKIAKPCGSYHCTRHIPQHIYWSYLVICSHNCGAEPKS